jgi:hypothetical protein
MQTMQQQSSGRVSTSMLFVPVEKQLTGGLSNVLTSSFAVNLGKGKSQTLQLLTEAYAA